MQPLSGSHTSTVLGGPNIARVPLGIVHQLNRLGLCTSRTPSQESPAQVVSLRRLIKLMQNSDYYHRRSQYGRRQLQLNSAQRRQIGSLSLSCPLSTSYGHSVALE